MLANISCLIYKLNIVIIFCYNLHIFIFQISFFIKNGVGINDYANKGMTMGLEMFSYMLYALCSTLPLK